MSSSSPRPPGDPVSPEQSQTLGLDRREIPQRSTTWAAKAADILHRARLSPNQISVLSVLFALVGAIALVWSATVGDPARIGLLAVAAACMPLRLLCNMLDGMLAVEKKLHSPTGDLFNELPDRIADVLLLAAAGYATAHAVVITSNFALDVGVLVGWLAAVLALFTAYVRTLGAAQSVKNYFDGPMAKPARMWVLVLACLASMLEPAVDITRGLVLFIALAVIATGSLLTVIIRLRRIVAAVRAKEAARAKEL